MSTRDIEIRIVVEFTLDVLYELRQHGRARYRAASLTPWQKQVLETLAARHNGDSYYLRRYKAGPQNRRAEWIIGCRQ
jgi:hypothetical protein